MASGRVANNPLGETSPHMESKIDLGMSDYRGKTRISFVMCQNNVIWFISFSLDSFYDPWHQLEFPINYNSKAIEMKLK